jgi:DNA-binding transcriptional regulator YiaG
LFQADHEGYLTDTAKLDRLVAEKLEALATEVRGEGWLWVEIQSGGRYTDLSKFNRIHSVNVPVNEEVRLEIEALQDEQERIEDKHPDAEEYPPDVDQRMAQIEARIEELNDRIEELNDQEPRNYREEEIPLAGAIVALENHGEAVIHRGLVRPEDRKKLAQAAMCETNGQHEPGDDNHDETDDEGLSAALVEDLTAHRTAALRTILATRADVALVAVTHALTLRMCYECSYDVGSCLSLSSEKGGCRLDSHAKGIETSPASVKLGEIQAEWSKRIPAQAEQLWQWLLDQEQTVVLDLLAFCVAQTVHVVRFAPRWASAALCRLRSGGPGRQSGHGRLVDADGGKLPWTSKKGSDPRDNRGGDQRNEFRRPSQNEEGGTRRRRRTPPGREPLVARDPEIVKQQRGEGPGITPPPLAANIKSMSQQTQSLSREALCFAIIDVMPNELTPLIQLLKKWRSANDLSQSQAVAAFQAGGLPVTLDTLQNWEIGRRAPRGLAAVALSDFLERHSKVSKPRT